MTVYKFKTSLLISLILCFSSAFAQEESKIIITTSPPGATVYLRGEMDLVANTPASLPTTISGRYKAEVIRAGYETWKGDFTFVPGSPNNISIKLSRKTRVKATLRSMIIPGWGQVYSGDKWRGYLITTGAVISAAAIYHFDRRFDKKRNDFDIARSNYENAVTIEEKIALKTVSDDKQRDAYRAETDRNTSLAVGAAFWAYNVLDAFLFFPEGSAYFPSLTSLGDGAALTFQIEF
jgi:hypothetical protein